MNFQLVYPKDLARLQKERGVVILDIRDREAYNRGHLQGCVSCPVNDVNDFGMRLMPKQRYVLICEHGASSMQLARQLGMKGYRVATLVGGYEAVRKYQKKVVENNHKS